MIQAMIIGAVLGGLGGLLAWGACKLLGLSEERTRMVAAVVVAAAAVGGGQIASALMRPSAAQAESALEENNVYRVLKAHYPAEARQIVRSIGTASRGGKLDAMNEVRPVISELIIRQTPLANAENTVALMRISRDQAQTALNHSPQACHEYLLGGGALSFDPSKVFSADLLQRELALTEALLVQTAMAPAPLNDAAQAEQDLESVAAAALQGLSPQEQQDMSAATQPGQGSAQQKRAFCRFSILMIDAALRLPPHRVADMFKIAGRG